jgi:hypothetical protein
MDTEELSEAGKGIRPYRKLSVEVLSGTNLSCVWGEGGLMRE